MKKRILALASVLALVAVLVAPMAALAEGVTTNLDANNVPDVTAVALYDEANTTPVTEGTGMTPTTTYTLRVTVTDYDTLADISQIDIAIFYDATGATTAPTTSALTTAGVFRSTNPTAETPTLSVVGTGGTWAAGTVTKPTLSGTSGYWSLKFTVGKIAAEALGQGAGGFDGWHLYAKVTDLDTATDEMYNRGGTNKGWAMGWYGAIDSSVTTNVDFEVVTAGAAFKQISKVDSVTATYFSIYSMANSMHKLTGEASAIGGVTFRTTDDTPEANEIVLTMDMHTAFASLAQGSGQRQSTSPVDITDFTSQAATTTSDTLTTVSNTDYSSMWIKAGAQVSGAKSTTVTYTIVND